MGWDPTFLQSVLDTCDDGVTGLDHCPMLQQNSSKCVKSNLDFNETVQGYLPSLPGCNPVFTDPSKISANCTPSNTNDTIPKGSDSTFVGTTTNAYLLPSGTTSGSKGSSSSGGSNIFINKTCRPRRQRRRHQNFFRSLKTFLK